MTAGRQVAMMIFTRPLALRTWLVLAVLSLSGCPWDNDDSSNATLTVTAAPTGPSITTQPRDATVVAGATATFSVVASGTPPLTYQWRRNGFDIAGATAANFTTPATTAGDSGAIYTVVVANSVSSVTSNAATLTRQKRFGFAVTLPPSPVTPPPTGDFYVDVWSSLDTTPGTGTVDLSVVHPNAPTVLIPVDTNIPAQANNNVLRVRGGTYDPTSRTISNPHTRHVVYLRDGAIFKVSLDNAGQPPAPVRLSTETQAQAISLTLAAQSLSGDEALIGYIALSGGRRYVMLSTGPNDLPTPNAVFPGDTSAFALLSASHDPSTGAIMTYFWSSVTLTGGRLFRTDPDFNGQVSIDTFTTVPLPAWPGSAALGGGGMRNGLFFYAGGALRRYDYSTGDVRIVHPDVTETTTGYAVSDDQAFVRLRAGGEARLVRLTDAPNIDGVTLASGAVMEGTNLICCRQLRDYVVVISNNGDTAVSVRKSDGLQTTLPGAPPGSLLFTWIPPGPPGFLMGTTAGNRVFYSRIDLAVFANIVGSVDADGTNRKEIAGLFGTIGMLPATLAPHRLAVSELDMPFDHFLVRVGSVFGAPEVLGWMSATSGDVVTIVGTVPANTLPSLGASPPYVGFVVGSAGAIARPGTFQVAPGNVATPLDAYFVSDQPNSIQRLTNNVPD